jgi:Family of unknown function (DUF6152)
MKTTLRLAILSVVLWQPLAMAHHSYAMFDLSKRSTVNGTVAKLEWGNPHVFVWLYVANSKGKYDLYALENGSISILSRYGWTRQTLKAGDKATIEYLPLKDGRNGGYFVKAKFADGRILSGDPFAPGGTAEIKFGPPPPGVAPGARK